MKLYDNTRLSCYKDCPRMFYFRHIRHWRPAGIEWPLVFGASWHAAMDVVWQQLLAFKGGEIKHELIARSAYKAFIAKWIEEGAPPPEQIDYEQSLEIAPRTPSQAWEMLVAYVFERAKIIQDYELIAIERPFAVPLDTHEELFYIGKIDKALRVKASGKVRGIEHKTSTAYKKGGPFRSGYIDSFSPNAQVDGYLYALHMLWPGQVAGIWVDAALVHKTEEGFTFIPVEKQLKMLDAWLWETRQWISRVEGDKDLLRRQEESNIAQQTMEAFPKNTNSCFNFNRMCPYMECCRAWPNPIGREMPPSMIEDKWDPLQHIGPIEGISDGKAAEPKEAVATKASSR